MKHITKAALSVVALALGACATPMPAQGPAATAKLEATRGNAVSGTVQFRQQGDKMRIEAMLTGLSPGPHGFHIHEKGDCSSGDGMSAGGHFNPLGKAHAHPTSPERHAGDLPQLDAGADGQARLEAEVDLLRIGDGATDILGRAVVVHAGPDDFKTQPTGNSGARVACGVIARS
jgi:Cu-Zn family superoxide dismutase